MLSIDGYDGARRTADFARFHAAQAFISEPTGIAAKPHEGAQTERQRLTRDIRNFESGVRTSRDEALTFRRNVREAPAGAIPRRLCVTFLP
jgi:hypothetical protein